MSRIRSPAAHAAGLFALSLFVDPQSAGATDVTFRELFDERLKSVVAVEFFVETETDRRPSTVVGMLADDNGLVVLLDTAIPGWLPPDQLKDFRVYRPGTRDGIPGTYLGQDFLTGWHFLRAGGEWSDQTIPATDFETAKPAIGDEVWGIGLMGKDFDFQPFLMTGRVSLIQSLPQQVGFSVSDIASPGAPVFSRAGAFIGWAGNPVPQERLLFLENNRYNVGVQNPNSSGSFYLASEVLPYLGRAPPAPTGQEIPWMGVVGLQPVDHEATEFLKIENRSAVVVSDVVKNGPADLAGIKQRDIIVSVNDQPFARFSPARVVTTFLEREILSRKPGDVMKFGIVRGDQRLETDVTIGNQPTPLKEARREYFSNLGITLREFVLFDRISRQMAEEEQRGVVANFVKPNSPASTAGLRAGDLIREIDGLEIKSYEDALQLMQAIEQDAKRSEFVLLISRATETSVIRVRLK
ncbi:MAG TPA: PDZ domain-containing protein [Opitutaceae bacterium]